MVACFGGGFLWWFGFGGGFLLSFSHGGAVFLLFGVYFGYVFCFFFF